jgi:hypothetical protein
LTAAQLVRDRQELKLDEVQRQVPVLVTQPMRELALMLEQQPALELELGPVLRLAQELPLVQLVHCDRCSRVHLLE